MKNKIIFFIIGLTVGWLTVPLIHADDNDFRSYKQALKVMINLMQDIKNTSQQTADNTKAIKEKLGVK